MQERISYASSNKAWRFVRFAHMENAMIRTWKLATLALVAAASIATPALAQNFTHSRHSGGFGAYAMVPNANVGRYSPAANGGGSAGYNWAIENDR